MDFDQSSPWAIAFHDVTLGYGEHLVLQHLTATLPAGKIAVILGGSGCGKSTLLRHIIGLNRPLTGTITLGEHNLQNLSSQDWRKVRRRLGVLFQDGALLGAMSVLENVALPLTEHLAIPKSLIFAEAQRILKLVGLENFGDFFPNQLSGGMRKRAGLARAIIAKPKVLLCDEPTSGLDPITAARMDDLLLSLHDKFPEITMVVVSHDLASLKRIAQYVLVLGEGECLFQGSLEDLLATDDPYLRAFLEREGGDNEFSGFDQMDQEIDKALNNWFAR
ncbi:MAG: ATP-binding cassette domain-containing protein [Desulfovibrionaceae bacterium]|nr:ATP-binding cassette domain-containing protein [Desulfovibrionaceae bacterium]